LTSQQTEPGGIYVHIPFCIRKCPYCDFYSIADMSLKQAFVDALMHEMELTGELLLAFDSLYIGGGTPSVLDASHIDKILERADKSFEILPGAEITIEANPGTVSLQQLKDYRSAGVNRINIGVQSFHGEHLDFLGRIHTKKETYSAIRWAREAGFENLGLDLIYGIQGQTKKSWLYDLQEAVGFMPEHISCYMLTYETDTPMDKDRQEGRVTPMADPLIADLYEAAISYLEINEYDQYETSNYAKSDSGGQDINRSRHNQKYWSFVNYVGFGPSAHSFIEPVRHWNVSNVEKYIEDLNVGRLPLAEKETLDKDQQMIEWVYLGLRQTSGIQIKDFNDKFDVSFSSKFREVLGDLEERELIEPVTTRCTLTRKGMLLLDSITSMLIGD